MPIIDTRWRKLTRIKNSVRLTLNGTALSRAASMVGLTLSKLANSVVRVVITDPQVLEEDGYRVKRFVIYIDYVEEVGRGAGDRGH